MIRSRHKLRLFPAAIMSLTTRPTHLERTHGLTRGDTSTVTVETVTQLSPTVRGFTLKAQNKELSFKPGQWVDVHIPTIETVGGYSITSAPYLLNEKGLFALAIQHSSHPPALWMTTQCQVGDKLWVQVGGDFFYDPLPIHSTSLSHDTGSKSHDSLCKSHDLILIAGGVGVNPLMSILLHHARLVEKSQIEESKVRLLYSARNISELLFKSEIDDLCSKYHSWLKAHYFVTREEQELDQKHPHIEIIPRRMRRSDVSSVLASLGSDGRSTPQARAYVCGPPPMIDHIMSECLTDCGFPQEHILVEKWW